MGVYEFRNKCARWLLSKIGNGTALHDSTVLEDRVGPFAMRADLTVDVTADASARTLHVSGSGEDRQIASRISASLDVAVRPDASGCARVGRKN